MAEFLDAAEEIVGPRHGGALGRRLAAAAATPFACIASRHRLEGLDLREWLGRLADDLGQLDSLLV